MPMNLSVTKPPDFIEFRSESIQQGVHQRIEKQVQLYPDKPAIVTRDVAYTYSEMNALANALANRILSASGSQLAQIAILQANTPDLIISLLASLKARKAYVPLDCNFPKERLRAMLDDADPILLLTDDEHLSLAEELCGKRIALINTSQRNQRPDAPDLNLECDPLMRAYILYTSGSTGRPKGIEFLHRNLLHTTMCLTNELFYSASDRVSWLHSPTFGSSIVDIYNCLTNGGTLYPWDAKAQGLTGMTEWMAHNKLTAFHWVPSAFRQFIRTVPTECVFEDIRIVVMAGEPLTIREVELFRRHFPLGSHLVNQVGTAESYNYYLYRVDHHIPIENSNVPGGYPVSPERQLLILEDSHKELPQGSVGEIAIMSEYMAAGYWRNEDLTKAKFIRLGSCETPVYLTGDLGKLEPDGCLIHLGRKDFQVKIRGCRVELAEVDHLLASAPGVLDATSWVARNRLGEDQLIGYVVLKEPGSFSRVDVDKHLRVTLPSYMIPSDYVILDSLPTLPTGKTDRRALPNPFQREESSTRATPSSASPVANEVLTIFRDLLQLDDVSMCTNFVTEGGDSLLSAVLFYRINKQCDVEIAAEEFFESPTPGRMVTLIEKARHIHNGHHVPGNLESKRNGHSTLSGTDRDQSAPFRGAKRSGSACRTTQNLIIIGAGQCGREVFTWAAQAIAAGASLRIKGFLDDKPDALNGYAYPAEVLGTVEDYEIEAGDVFIGAIGSPAAKVNGYLPIIQKGGRFISLIHPLANVGTNVDIGDGVVLAPFSSVTADVRIGNHVSIGALSNIAHDVVIGDWCQISSHCGLNGMVTLGEGGFLGSHACIIPGVTVGPWAYVGAGSVVVKDVSSGIKVFGNPAMPIGKADCGRRENPALINS